LKLAKGELPAVAKRHMTAKLPQGKSVVDLFADFIRYLFDSTVAHIKEAEPTGEVLWTNFGPTVELVLTHPNGWEGHQQEVMRKAVVQAEIFNKEEARSRVSFVTEGEASFNYCVTSTKSGESLEVDCLLVDADRRVVTQRFSGRPQGFGHRRRWWNDRHKLLHCAREITVEG